MQAKELSKDKGRGHHDHKIDVKVNEKRVMLQGHKQTGLKIKLAAIEQGVNIEKDFVLSLEGHGGHTRIIGDEDKITVHDGDCFSAVPHDDNSRGLGNNVEAAIAKIRTNFPKSSLEVAEDGKGGAFVIVDSVPLGHPYSQDETWFGFHVTAACEYADCYPHFVRHDLTRADGRGLGEGFSSTTFQWPDGPKPAVQISRKTNRPVMPSASNPLLKLLKVIAWMKSQ